MNKDVDLEKVHSLIQQIGAQFIENNKKIEVEFKKIQREFENHENRMTDINEHFKEQHKLIWSYLDGLENNISEKKG